MINQKGRDWIATIGKPKNYLEPKYSDSILQERMMRIGIEFKLYSDGDTSDIETIARATLREDFIKSIDK